MRRTSKLSAIALVIMLATCGGSTLLKSFRVALASSSPLVNSLVAAGTIPETKATAIIADFDAGAQCGLTLQNDFAAIPKDLPANEIKSQKLKASLIGLGCFRQIVNRQNFAAHPRIQQIANIAEGILASMSIFYSDVDGSSVNRSLPPNVVTANSEKDLERKLKTKVKALELAMQP